jgi:hypothetical protein
MHPRAPRDRLCEPNKSADRAPRDPALYRASTPCRREVLHPLAMATPAL